MRRDWVTGGRVESLSRYLGCDVPAAVGYVVLLEYASRDCEPRGHIGTMTDEQIAASCYWAGEVPDFIEGLTRAGFLREDPTFRLIILGKNPAHQRAGTTPQPTYFPTGSLRWRDKLVFWARSKGVTEAQTDHAIERVRLWSESKGIRRLSWYATIQGAITSGWGMPGGSAPTVGNDKPKGQAYQDVPRRPEPTPLTEEEIAEGLAASERLREQLRVVK